MQEEFGQLMNRFLDNLGRALPGAAHEDLRWRFHFMVGAMMQLLAFGAPLGMKTSENYLSAGFTQLKQFVVAGLLDADESSGRNS